MFTHLHVHSHYSLLDGLPKIDDLVAHAAAQGFSALALTDHGTLYGAIEFYNACRTLGIKPIIGMEAYIAPRGMEDKSGKVDSDYHHLTLLAENNTGYKNLIQLTTEAHLRGFYYTPRIDLQFLKQHASGLIALSGCQRGALARAVMSAQPERESEVVARYLDIFGRENFFVEIQRNAKQNQERETELNRRLIASAQEHTLKLIATADSHYLKPEDAEAQDVLMCIGTGRTVAETNRLDMRAYELSLKSADSMRKLFADLPESISNTMLIAERCKLDIPTNQRYFPKVHLPPGETAESFLTKTVWHKALSVYPDTTGRLGQEITDRIAYELDVICKTGFAPYCLMVADIVQGAHAIGAITNTRGSAAGSIVSYILGISSIDPIYYQLPFERFLTVYRPTPPDIDLDISDNRRDELIQWITDRYGHDKVAQIITFGTMMARAALRDVGRALGIAYSKCDRIAKMIPFGKQGFHMTLDRALQINPELKQMHDQDPETKHILDIARKLEGGARHASIHAAALAITPTPLTDYTPLQKEPGGERLITQYDMYTLDVSADSNALGVVKMDLLGIRNLSILEAAVRLVEQRRKATIDIYNLPHPDPATFALLSNGLTFGVFQLGSSGITRYLKELRPKNIFDIMAMIALYRPGPMSIIPEYIARNHDPRRISYFDPRMKDSLERSLGLLVYQDDVLLTAINIAGYSWEEADKLRKAMGKKIPEDMANQKVYFIAGCVKNGMRHGQAAELFKLIEPFAAYGFGKAHAASYAQVSYQTAYMKANYPVEFMTALMTAEAGNLETVAEAVTECTNLGITVLPPDVNESLDGFTVIDDRHIRFGLGAVKNLGSDVIQKIIADRRTRGPYTGLADFILRAHVRNFNKKSWEALAKSGALDQFGERNELLANTDMVLNAMRNHSKEEVSAQSSLFGALPPTHLKLNLTKTAAATDKDKLAWEKELLGLYVTAHPLREHRVTLQALTHISDIKAGAAEASATIGGILTKIKIIITKKGEQMCFAQLEDLTGSIELIVFPRCFSEARAVLVPEAIVKVWGKYSSKDGEPKILADKITPLTAAPAAPENQGQPAERYFAVTVPPDADPLVFRKLKAVFERYPGPTRVTLSVPSPHAAKQPILTDFRINEGEDLKKAVADILRQ